MLLTENIEHLCCMTERNGHEVERLCKDIVEGYSIKSAEVRLFLVTMLGCSSTSNQDMLEE